jgi:integrase
MYERRDRFSVNNLQAFFKDECLLDITAEMIERYKAARLESVEPATVNRELACLKHMYTKAIEWGYARTSPAKVVRKLKEPPGRLRYLKPEEVEALLSCCSEHLRPLVVTAVNTGMRRGELFDLKWPQVDLRNRKITVVNTKNNESRVVPVNQTLYRELAGLRGKSESEYVFLNRDGDRLKDVRAGFLASLKRAGIKDFRFHDLRHTFGSHLVMQGVDLRTVQQVMGHKDIKMTMRYSHLSPEYVHEAIERLDNLWTLFGHQQPVANDGMSHNYLK